MGTSSGMQAHNVSQSFLECSHCIAFWHIHSQARKSETDRTFACPGVQIFLLGKAPNRYFGHDWVLLFNRLLLASECNSDWQKSRKSPPQRPGTNRVDCPGGLLKHNCTSGPWLGSWHEQQLWIGELSFALHPPPPRRRRRRHRRNSFPTHERGSLWGSLCGGLPLATRRQTHTNQLRYHK